MNESMTPGRRDGGIRRARAVTGGLAVVAVAGSLGFTALADTATQQDRQQTAAPADSGPDGGPDPVQPTEARPDQRRLGDDDGEHEHESEHESEHDDEVGTVPRTDTGSSTTRSGGSGSVGTTTQPPHATSGGS